MSAPTTAGVSSIPTSRRAYLAHYGVWQLRDYAIGRGAPTFLLMGLFGALGLAPLLKAAGQNIDQIPPRELHRLMAAHGSMTGIHQAMMHDMGTTFLRGFIGSVIFLGAVFAMNGLVSNDRKLGYYRFLFSKPISPMRYYGQAFLIHWAGFLVVGMLLGALYGAYVEQIVTPSLLAVLGLVYLFYAGIAFLMTTLVRWDWLGTAGIVISAQLLWDHFGESTSGAGTMLYLLPPIHKTGDAYTALVAGTPLPWHILAWLGGYGAVSFIVGLAVLRLRRLAVS